MATSLIIDTRQFVEDLKTAGFTENQADGLIRALQRSDLNHLVTKADLKGELRELELRLTNRMITIVGVATAVLAFLKFFG